MEAKLLEINYQMFLFKKTEKNHAQKKLTIVELCSLKLSNIPFLIVYGDHV